MAERVKDNTRIEATILLGGAGVGALIVVGVDLILGGGLVGLIIGWVLVALLVLGFRARSTSVVLRAVPSEPADGVEFAQYRNLVAGLRATAGLPEPQLRIIRNEARNACAMGRDPNRAIIVVTTGLLENLDRVELEGVLAHELSLVKSGNIGSGTLIAALGQVLPQLATMLRGLITPVERIETADIEAVRLTRYPPGLMAALEKLEGGVTAVERTPESTAHLWLATPSEGGVESSGREVHPPIAERIERLREL